MPRPFAHLLSSALLLAVATPAAAQYPAGATVQPLPRPDDPGERLAVALRTLAVSPGNLDALIAAGRNALLLGDPSAAVGFLGRADQIAPRDGRVKAGLGAALVQLDRPADALRQFAQASTLGVADADLAADRGLARDLSGDPAAAQRDYRIALTAHPDDEAVRRRLALSQGIAGDRGAAIATLDPLIRKRDIAAWRAQTFVLAMTGDAPGANAITRVMLPQQQAMLQPFLVRLAALTPAEKARAVHFGEMPAGGSAPVRMAGSAPPVAAPSAAAPVASDLAVQPIRAPQPQVALAQPAPASAAASPLPAGPASPAPAAASPQRVATAQSAPAAAMSTAPPGYHYVRRLRNAQDSFSMPGYEYVVVRVPDAKPPTQVATVASAPPVRLAMAAPAVQAQAPAASAPVQPAVVTPSTTVATPSAALQPAPAAPASNLAVPPAVTVANGSGTPSVPAMPIGSSAMGGHYDLPHAALPRVTARSPILPRATAPATSAAPRVSMNATRVAVPVATVNQPAKRRKAIPPSDGMDADTPAPAGGSGIGSASSRRGSATRMQDAEPEPAASSRTSARADDAKPERGSAKSGKRRADPGDEDRLATTDDGERPSTARVRDKSSAGSKKGSARDRASATSDESDEATPRSRTVRGKVGAVSGKDTAKDRAPSDDADREASPRGRTKSDGARSGRKATDAGSGSSSSDDETEAKTRGSARDKGGSTSKKAATRSDDDAKDAKPSPRGEKVYVQVAGGANRDDLGKAWDGVRKKAPELMRGKSPSTTSLHATNRLLVGPFKDEDEAQTFVNKMAGKGVSGFVYRNARGKKVEKVDTGG